MDVMHGQAMQWRRGSKHRDDSIRFKDLFHGDDQAPNNYWFTLVRVESYQAPTHKHNFDQVRFMLDGGFGFGPRVQEEGTVGYFTEGLPYTQNAIGPNVHLLLQCEGGSRAPYVSQNQVNSAVAELATSGEFANGHYVRDGRSRDSFEAVWEHIVGREVEYPEPRFQEPVIMDPRAFRWVEDADQPGLSRKMLGNFTERSLQIALCKIEAGKAAMLAGGAVPTLLFVVTGDGTFAGVPGEPDEVDRFEAHTAIRLQPGEQVTVTAATEATLFSVTLPN